MTETVKYRSRIDWVPEIVPSIEGKVVVVEKLPADKVGREARVLIIDSPVAQYRVYESYDLKPVFDGAVPGDMVRLEFQRAKVIKGGKTLKQYNAKLWTP
jgi:hypothetical protein